MAGLFLINSSVEMGGIEPPSAHAEEETLHAVVWLLI